MGLLNESEASYYDDSASFGDYQFVSLNDVVNQFMVVYVGEDKLISKASRTDVAFHAQRGLAEMSFDTLKSCKAQEITLPPSLQMILPQDYVNYTKISWVDSAGIKHLLYPTSKTSNPTPILQNTNGTYYSNLISNSSFQSGIDGWTTTGVSVHYPITTSSNGLLRTSTATGSTTYPLVQQDVTLVDGQAYRLSFNLLTNETIASNNKVFLYGALGGNGSYRPVNVVLGSSGLGVQSYDFIFDNDSNNNLNTMRIAIELSHGDVNVKKVEITGFELVAINNDGNYALVGNNELVDQNDSTTWSSYKSGTPSENQDDYQDDTYWPMEGSRYGLDPQHAQANGSFYIDCVSGKIHFSSNIAGKTVILDYISDSLGTDGEMQVHKFAEEAMYKWISHGILSGKSNIPEYQVNRLKKERFAAVRTAKLRLSNLKLEELTQILRGKSKQIKH